MEKTEEELLAEGVEIRQKMLEALAAVVRHGIANPRTATMTVAALKYLVNMCEALLEGEGERMPAEDLDLYNVRGVLLAREAVVASGWVQKARERAMN